MQKAATPASKAQNNPVIIGGALDTSQQDIGQAPDRLLRSTGPAEKALDTHQNISIGHYIDPEKMAMLKFMDEKITIRIGTTTDKNAAQVFETNVNNNPTMFQRGGTYTVKRFIVDHLLRLKETVYTQKEVFDADGVRQFLHIPHTALKYDFSIVRDDNPLGKEWERHTLLEPA